MATKDIRQILESAREHLDKSTSMLTDLTATLGIPAAASFAVDHHDGLRGLAEDIHLAAVRVELAARGIERTVGQPASVPVDVPYDPTGVGLSG